MNENKFNQKHDIERVKKYKKYYEKTLKDFSFNEAPTLIFSNEAKNSKKRKTFIQKNLKTRSLR